MGFRDKRTGEKTYKRSKNVPVVRGISWGIASIAGRKTAEKALAFVPYSTNPQQCSRWGAMDFDAHDGDSERARSFAFAALDELRLYEFGAILESSGSGGWHLFAISTEFKPVEFWKQLLKGIAAKIGARIEDGICEIFPPDTLSQGFGLGLRAPGSWNPGTNKLSLIYWHNANELIEGLPDLPRCIRPIGEVRKTFSVTSSIEKEVYLSSSSLSRWGWLLGSFEWVRITECSTRHNRLRTLVGSLFHQVSRPIAEHLAKLQFLEKTVPTKESQLDHMREFGELWEGLERQWLNQLSECESERFSLLSTDAERYAFRIVRNYAQKAAVEGQPDFPIVRDNLALRINLTGRGAGFLRLKFVNLGIIEPTQPYRANVAAARYRWIADICQPF